MLENVGVACYLTLSPVWLSFPHFVHDTSVLNGLDWTYDVLA